jgi:hypothetical protein
MTPDQRKAKAPPGRAEIQDALATAGMLVHWVTSDPELIMKFAAYIEISPGQLDGATVHDYLVHAHSVLNPGCDEPMTPWPGEGSNSHRT